MAVSADSIESRAQVVGAEPATGFADYIRRVASLCDECPEEHLAPRVAREKRRLVASRGWLPEACREPGDETYRRHVIYVDPLGRFTVLAVVWRRGQYTPIHGHTAWGAVGVYEGNPRVSSYRLLPDGRPEFLGEAICCPGDVSFVRPGTVRPHRVGNDGEGVAITIHTYGRDLLADPASINIPLGAA